MGVNPQITGRTYPPSPAYEVGREKIREFAEAINSADVLHRDPQAAQAAGYPDVIAPPTFAVIIAQRCEAQIMRDPDAGIDFTRVVHGEQRFVHHRPIAAGDRLTAILHVDDARVIAGNGRVITRVEITDADGEPVTTSTSMILVRAEDPAGSGPTGSAEPAGNVGETTGAGV
jgi:acyl dehydratase